LSRNESGKPLVDVVIADTDLFFFYLRGGRCELQAENVIEEVGKGNVELKVSSETYDDAISAIRADELPLAVARSFISDIKLIPHTALPLTVEIAEEAIGLYSSHGGRSRLSYFDSFHVATARRYNLPLLTSDRYIIQRQSKLGVEVIDLSSVKPTR
jgi:predicted nucleic acid-binding protein